MNNSLLPSQRGEKTPPGYRAKSSFLSSLQKKKGGKKKAKSTKSYQPSAFSTIGAQIIDYV